MRPPLLAVLLPLGTLACGTGASKSTGVATETGSAGPDTFRVVFIADTHVIGPEYTCCSESPGLDNDSIMKTPDRLAQVRDAVNALDPQPDLVFVLGDVVHDALVFADRTAYQSEETGYSKAWELFDGFQAPVHYVWGNHDYEVSCNPDAGLPRDLAHGVFEDLFATQPYSSVDHKGWRFILANSQLGPTWTPTDPLCNTSFASYGAEQLAWIDGLLADGRPTMVMAHYYTAVTKLDEQPGAELSDLPTVLDRHDNMRLFLAGHFHRWVDARDADTFPQVVLGATRYDTDNFWLFEFTENSDEYVILDEEKPRWGTTCADTWLYSGTPEADPSAEELGDCTDG